MQYSVKLTGNEAVDRNLQAIEQRLKEIGGNTRLVAATSSSVAVTVPAGQAVDLEFLSSEDSKGLADIVPGMAVTATPPSWTGASATIGLAIQVAWVVSKGRVAVRVANPSGGALVVPAGTWAFLGAQRA